MNFIFGDSPNDKSIIFFGFCSLDNIITIIIFYPIIETWSGSVLAIVIAVLEIGVAFTVWLKYYIDQKKLKKISIQKIN